MPSAKQKALARGLRKLNISKKQLLIAMRTKKTKGRKKTKAKTFVKAVKQIAKKVVIGSQETNYYEFKGYITTSQAIGNPKLSVSPAGDGIPRPRYKLLTNYPATFALDKGQIAPSVLSEDNGLAEYSTKQDLYLRNIQLKLELTSPYGLISGSAVSQWCEYHWAIIRTTGHPNSSGIPNIALLFKNNFETQAGKFKKDSKLTGFSIVKQGIISMNPLLTGVNGNNFSARVVRRTINIPLKKQMKLLRHVHQNGYTDAQVSGNLNNVNYWFIEYCNQQFQEVNETSHLYNNNKETINPTAGGGINGGITRLYQYTLSGYGKE